MKIDRAAIHQKYGQRCSYCGCEISLKQMHVDHIVPVRRWLEIRGPGDFELNDIRNLNPSCGPCNRWKSTFMIEEFRSEIAEQVNRLRKYSAAFRMAERYEMIEAKEGEIFFWFEKYGKE